MRGRDWQSETRARRSDSPRNHIKDGIQFSTVQSLSRVQLFETPWTAACQASLSITNSRSSLKLTSIESVMPYSHLILCRPLLLLPPIPPSIKVFSNESTLRMRWPKNWSFSFSIIPSKQYPGVISFRMDWLDLLAVQGTLKSLLQHHSSKAAILWHSIRSSPLNLFLPRMYLSDAQRHRKIKVVKMSLGMDLSSHWWCGQGQFGAGVRVYARLQWNVKSLVWNKRENICSVLAVEVWLQRDGS